MNNTIVGIDVGTSQVKVIVARGQDGHALPSILGTGYAESRGVKQGYITSVADAARSIAAAAAQASKAARVPIKRAYVSVGGVGIEEAFARGEAVVERGDSEITERDIPHAIAAAERALPPSAKLNRKIIHTIPLFFVVDGVRFLGRSPLGMKGARVSVEVLFITCLERHVADLVAAVDEAGIEVEDIVAAPLAASFVALTKTQKNVGCVLANLGSETLSLVVFEDAVPISIKVFPTGSSSITNDLALGLRIAPEEAEELKRGAVLGAPFPKKKVDDLIAKRLSDMLKLVEHHLKKIGKDALLPGGIILTGGGSSIQTVSDLAKAVLHLPARVATLAEGSPGKIQIGDGSWAVAFGLCVWGTSQGGNLEVHEETSFSHSLKSLWRWFKKFLP